MVALHVVLPPIKRIDRAPRWAGWPCGLVVVPPHHRAQAPDDLLAAVDLAPDCPPSDAVFLPDDMDPLRPLTPHDVADRLRCVIAYAVTRRPAGERRHYPDVIDVGGRGMVLSARWLRTLTDSMALLRQVPEHRRRPAWAVDGARRTVLTALRAAAKSGADLRAMMLRVECSPSDIGLYAFYDTPWRSGMREQEHPHGPQHKHHLRRTVHGHPARTAE